MCGRLPEGRRLQTEVAAYCAPVAWNPVPQVNRVVERVCEWVAVQAGGLHTR